MPKIEQKLFCKYLTWHWVGCLWGCQRSYSDLLIIVKSHTGNRTKDPPIGETRGGREQREVKGQYPTLKWSQPWVGMSSWPRQKDVCETSQLVGMNGSEVGHNRTFVKSAMTEGRLWSQPIRMDGSEVGHDRGTFVKPAQLEWMEGVKPAMSEWIEETERGRGGHPEVKDEARTYDLTRSRKQKKQTENRC